MSEQPFFCQLPEQWYLTRIANVFRENREPGCQDLPILSVSISSGISDHEISEEDMERRQSRIEDRSMYRRVRPGDLAYNMMRAWQGAYGIARVDGLVSPAYVVARPTTKIDVGYFDYLFRSEAFAHVSKMKSRGITDFRLRLYWEAFRQIRIPYPNIETQRSIAELLDCEIARIDALIEKKERFAQKITQREEAGFLGLVTGKHLSGPRCASGVDWIGDLPEGWLAPKLTHVARQETGHTPSRKIDEYWVAEECVIPWVSLADVWQLRSGEAVYLDDTAEKISELGMANSAARLLPKDTVILSRTASVGFAAILGKPMATTQDFAGWICGKRLRPKFLYYVLRAMKPEFRRLMMGSTHQTIYMPDIRAFRTPLPPICEQDRIVSALDSSIGKYRQVHRKTLESLGRLREFRAALITAAVTGRIDPAKWRRRGEDERRLDALERDVA